MLYIGMYGLKEYGILAVLVRNSVSIFDILATNRVWCLQPTPALGMFFRPGLDAVLVFHMCRIKFEFRSTQITLDRLN